MGYLMPAFSKKNRAGNTSSIFDLKKI